MEYITFTPIDNSIKAERCKHKFEVAPLNGTTEYSHCSKCHSVRAVINLAFLLELRSEVEQLKRQRSKEITEFKKAGVSKRLLDPIRCTVHELTHKLESLDNAISKYEQDESAVSQE